MPLDLGVPSTLALHYYPGLVLYARQQGIIGTQRLDPKPINRIQCTGHPGTRLDILMTLVEAAALNQLWRVLYKPLAKTTTADGQLLACHGDIDPDYPDQSCLFLANGPLTFHHILSDKKQPWLVIVSACLAANIQENRDGDPLGLATGFFLQGTRYLIASLFPISDLWTPIFMLILHTELKDNSNPYESLRKAKQQFTNASPAELQQWAEQLIKLSEANLESMNEQLYDYLNGQFDHFATLSDQQKQALPEPIRAALSEAPKSFADTRKRKAFINDLAHQLGKYIMEYSRKHYLNLPPLDPVYKSAFVAGFRLYG